MKKKIVIAVIIILVLLIAAFALSIVFSLYGNPVSHYIVRRAAEDHLKAQYSDTDYAVEAVGYNFKFGNYYAHISSPSVVDGEFTLGFRASGEFIYDDYERRVLGKGNVAQRLNGEYFDKVKAALSSESYPYAVDIGYGDLIFERYDGEPLQGGAISREELILGGEYDVGALGATNGELVIYIDTDEPTAERAADILTDTKDYMANHGISFYHVTLILRKPPLDPERPYERPEGELHLREFLASDIYNDGIISRIEACAAATEAYYAEQDEIKAESEPQE